MRSILFVAMLSLPCAAAEPARPNILWISTEDISPDLGCYGDSYAVTPTIDQLAKEGVRYTHCFTHAGVCAPSRSGLITGRFPPSIGTHHMRCKGVPPAEVKCFTEHLRRAGYYCANNVKTDYQFDVPLTAWDENSNQADWRGRSPGQPFFCVRNFTTTHESQIRDPAEQTRKLVSALPAAMRHDPEKALVPVCYPDTPIVRRDIANYYDNISAMDGQVRDVLARLEADGLADDTIVWFWGDHGRGMPHYKRWLYDSGTHVPLIIRVPEKWRDWVSPGHPERLAPGSVNDQLVAFLDFAPTMLNLARLPLPADLHGQAFLGPNLKPPREYIYGHRDRMDEAYDLIRMVRDRRYQYIRNFRPDVSYAQDISYMNQMPTMQELRRLHAAGELPESAAVFMRDTKPAEELYDTQADPQEIRNLASNPAHRDTLERLRAECERWMLAVEDIGLIPEPIFDELKRPGADWLTTPQPGVTLAASPHHPEQWQATLTSAEPGAGLVYSFDAQEAARPADRHWLLYDAPFLVTKGQPLRVRASRIGFKDSPPVVVKTSAEMTREASPATTVPQWRDVVRSSNVLPRLLELKRHDGETNAGATVAYLASLSDPAPAMRYWAIRGLMTLPAESRTDALRKLVKQAQSDVSPAVRIVAAEYVLRDVDDADLLAFLAKAMRSEPQESVRLQAVTVLRDLGPRAKPVQADLEAAAKDGEYVGRIAQTLLNRWRTEQN